MKTLTRTIVGVGFVWLGISVGFTFLSHAKTPPVDRTQKVKCILDMHSKISIDAYFPFGAAGPMVLQDGRKPLIYLVRGDQIRVIALPYFNDPSRKPLLRVQVFDQDFYILESIAGGIEESYDVCTGTVVNGVGSSPRSPSCRKVDRADLTYRLSQIRAKRYPVSFVLSSDSRKEPAVKDREPSADERARAEALLDQVYLEVPGSLSCYYRQELWGVFGQIQAHKRDPILPGYDSVFQMLDTSACAEDPAYQSCAEIAKREIREFYDRVASRLTALSQRSYQASLAQ